MLHACSTPIALSFTIILWSFYAISDTNLLTTCHSASPCFLLFLVSEKLHRKYSRNWTKQKPKLLFFPEPSRAPKESCNQTRGWSHPPLARPGSGRAKGRCGPPAGPPTPSFRLYIAFVLKVTRQRLETPEKFRRRRHRQP